MSLLNDMLQDLQQQPDKDHETNDEHNRAQLRESGLIKTTSVPWIATAVVFITVLLLLLVIKQKFGYPQENLAETMVAKDQPPATQSVTPTDLILPTENSKETIQSLSDATQVEPQQSAPALKLLTHEQQAQIDLLLMRARQAIARDRLTSPFEDNAYRYYQDVLAIAPENALATQGLLQLADSYLAMADKRLEGGNLDAAQQLLQRAQLVAPDYLAVAEFTGKLHSKLVNQSVDISQVNSAAANNKKTEYQDSLLPENQEKFVKQTSTEKQKPEPTQQSSSIQDPFTATNDTPYLSVTPNIHWQDQQKTEQAKLLLRQGKTGQAILALEDFVSANQGAAESTRLLLEIYCEQQRIQDAQSLLASADYLEKVDHHYFKARIALVNQQPLEAMTLLEAGLSMAEKHEQYRALLAGVYQKTAHYPQAANSYKRLLEIFGEKPAYWLGYALALDAMEQKASALQAYQRLSEYQELQTEIRQYIEQRIAALQG